MRKYSFILLIIFCISTFGAEHPLRAFLNTPLLKNANVSLMVKDLNTNQVLYRSRATCSEIPASTMKLITTATALEILGADFCFQTALEIDGKITADSLLDGNLYIRGGGDPTLGSAILGDSLFLTKWVAAVRRAGINRISGKIVADASIYDDEGVNQKWTWEDMGNYYASGVYGISYLDNTCQVLIRSGKEGSKPEIFKTIPEIPELIFDNKLKSSAISFDSAYFYGTPLSNSRCIRGEIPANRDTFIVKCDIPRPALLLAQHFNKILKTNGIKTTLPPTDSVTTKIGRNVIYTHFSPALGEIIKEINVESNNHYAEHLFRYLALQNDSVATSHGAVRVIRSFWEKKGLPIDQLFMCDGSGLSPTNAVSAQFDVDLLSYMKNDSINSEVFFHSLPVSGESGTMKSVLKKTVLSGKVHAKSGTISRVKCYAGYLATKKKNYCFAILVNNANGSSKDVVKAIEKFLLQIGK